MKYLIVGLGNVGPEYDGTRHNIGFRVMDALVKASNIVFEDKRYGFVARMRVKNCELVLLKPSTYMNLSGNAVRYWMNKENVEPENLLVVCDDLSLPFGKLRMKPGGSDAGHNGLKNIASVLCSQQYARLRFGIGNDYPKGFQADYVLGQFTEEDLKTMDERVDIACEAVKSFCLAGINITMNQFNRK
jgi:PTH1 family peptidyl-tRNA hydrolase